MTVDRTLRHIDDTLTEATMPTTPTDRIPAPRVDHLSTTANLRRQRDDLHREITQTRDVLARTGHQSATASTPALVDQLAAARDKALAELVDAWVAIGRSDAGHIARIAADGTDNLADHIRRLAADRDDARATLVAAHHTICAQAEQIRRDGTLIGALEDVMETLDRARAAHDTITTPAQDAAHGPDGADGYSDEDGPLTDALRRTESAIIDSDDDIWRPVEGDRWKTVGYNPMTRDKIDKMFGPLRTVLLVDIDQDDEQDDDRPSTAADCPTCTGPTRQTVGMVCPTCGTDYAAEAEVAAPGSDPDRAQDIRPAAWEQQATDAAADALGDAWHWLANDPTSRTRLATAAVRAIIDAGLAGHGGRCHKCGTGFPRTPADPEPLCWTCATEEQTGLDEYTPDRAEKDATLAQIARDAAQDAADITAGRVSDRLGDPPPGPKPGQFCTAHFSWLCQAGQGRCQGNRAG